MNEGQQVDASYTLHEAHACGGRGKGRGFRFLILLIILGAIFFHTRQNERRVEAITWERSDVSAVQAPIEAPIPPSVEQGPFDDRVVSRGEVIKGDLVVYSGNVTIQPGGVVEGDLVLFSGNAVIESGAVVEGDLTVWSGNVTVHGTVEGDIAAMSGNITLEDGAVVGGGVSSFSGNIERNGSVSVDGDVVSGISKGVPFWQSGKVNLPDMPEIPDMPAIPDAPSAPDAPVIPAGRGESFSFFERVIFLIGRLLFAAVVTVAVSLLSVAVFSVRPNALTAGFGRMREKLGRAFALGAATNFGLLLAMQALFAVGFCFAPIAVITFLGLVALVVMGYGIVARLVGGRVLTAFNRTDSGIERKPALEIAAGAFVLTAALGFLSAITASTWVFFIGVLLLSAPGVGALIMPWIERVRNRKTQDLTSPGARTAAAGSAANASAFGTKYPMPAAAGAAAAGAATVVKPYAPARPVQPVAYASAPVAPAAPATNPLSAEDVSAKSATSAAADLSAIDLSAIDTAPSATSAAPVSSGEWVLEPPTSLQQDTASAAPYSLELPEAATPAPAGTPGVTVEDLVQAADADKAAQDAVKAAEVAARERAVDVSVGDDLTRIVGLGKSSERKLKGAGIFTFAQLAAVPAEIIATILGVPVEEVIEDEIGKQASALVGGR